MLGCCCDTVCEPVGSPVCDSRDVELGVSIKGEELTVELNRVMEESVTFPVEIPNGIHINSVVWSALSTKKVMAVLKPDEPPKILSSIFKERLSVPYGSYSLKLDNLTEADSGSYTVKIYTDGHPIQKDFKLQVFRKLVPPEIEVLSSVISVAGTCRIKLKCILKEGGGGHVMYTWKHCKGNTKEREESVLDLQLTARDSGIHCTCEARNAVSESYSGIHPMSLCDTGSMGNSGGSSQATNSAILRSILMPFIVWILFLGI